MYEARFVHQLRIMVYEAGFKTDIRPVLCSVKINVCTAQ